MTGFIHAYLEFCGMLLGLTGLFFGFACVMYFFVIYPAQVIKNMCNPKHRDYWRNI